MRLAPAIVIAILTAFPSSVGAAEPRYALIVGNNEGSRFEKDLRYAEDDARKVRDVLVEVGRFDAENVVTVLGGDSEKVRKAAGALAERIKETGGTKGIFILYYSGHADEGGLSLGRSRLPNAEVKALLAASNAPIRIGILDACNSGALTRTKGGVPGPDFAVSLDSGGSQEGEVLITSSRGEERSLESEGLRGSFFTHHLVSALRGDADQSGDGRVTLGEAYQYAYHRTIINTGSQHPAYEYNLKGTGDVVLTEPAAATCGIVFPAGIEGRYLVYRAAELQVAAEVDKPTGVEKRLSLSPGGYVVKKTQGESVLIARIRLMEGDSHRLDESVMTRVARADDFTKGPAQGPIFGVEGRLGAQVFLTAWSRDNIAGPTPMLGLALALNKYPFDAADLRVDLGFSMGGQSLALSDDGGDYKMPMTLTEVNTGLCMPVNLHLGPVALFAGPRLSALYIKRNFSQRSDQYFVAYPGIQTGAGYLIEGSISLRLELNLNYVYLKLDDDVKNLGTFEPYLGIGVLL